MSTGDEVATIKYYYDAAKTEMSRYKTLSVGLSWEHFQHLYYTKPLIVYAFAQS